MFHTIVVVGNLGREPEMRFTPKGTAVTNFSVAASRKYKNSEGELVEVTNWFKIATWGNMAETCNQYLHKGSKVLVEGELTPDPETGGPKVFLKNDGTYGASYEINAKTVRFLSSKGDTGGSAQEEVAQEEDIVNI